jgi:hypothetical protein
MAAEDEVRQASEQFYAALNSTLDGDSSPMEQIWSHGSDVSAMHPFGGRMLGWEEVRDSWEQAAQAFSWGQVALDEMVVFAISEDAAYTLGTEHGQASIGEGRHRLAGDEHLPSRRGRMEDSAPPHRFLLGGGGSPRSVGGPRRVLSRAGV